MAWCNATAISRMLGASLRQFFYNYCMQSFDDTKLENGFEKSKHLVNESFSSDTLQSLKRQNIDRKLYARKYIYPVVDVMFAFFKAIIAWLSFWPWVHFNVPGYEK